MQVLPKTEKTIKYLSWFGDHPPRTFNFILYNADLFNKREQLKPSDFRVTKSYYTVFTIWFDFDSLHTKSIDSKDESYTNKPLTNLNRHSILGLADLTKSNIRISRRI